LDTRHNTPALQSIHEGQGIHHGGKHAHVVCSGAVHANFQADAAAPEVASPNDDGDIHAQFTHFANPFGNMKCALGINAKPLRAGKRFATQFEQDAVIFQAVHSTS